MADASPSDPIPEVPPQPSPRDPETQTAAADAVAEPAAAEPAPAPRAGPSAEPDAKAPGPNEDAFAEAETSGEIVVTGARVARPNLTSPSPVTVVGQEEVTLAGRRAAARRGDWNACTIDDPGRDLGGCRASSRIAPGLARAWEGDWDGAVRAFDSVIAAAPRSSAAYLNRGMIHRRRGELHRALDDLDRAVRYAPRAARNYYHRSLVLRQLGDVRRARADEARAVELDPRYGVVLAPQR
jgi:tetratricopeptide (TPR) repeat protein